MRGFAALCALAVAGCATATATAPPISIPISSLLREPCPRPPGYETAVTVGDLAAFSVRQEAAISVCNERRAAVVSVLDAYNSMAAQMAEKLKPRPWWRLF